MNNQKIDFSQRNVLQFAHLTVGLFLVTFEDLIRKYTNFTFGISGAGWNTTYCEYCGDGKRVQGPRGGWLFADGGNTAFYHCFNCGCNESFSLNREHKFSKNMMEILDAFGIPKTEYIVFILGKNVKNELPKTSISYNSLELPDHFIHVDNADVDVRKQIRTFLKTNYDLKISDYGFYYGTGNTSSKNVEDRAIAGTFKHRLIIPFYHRGKVIYYQGRRLEEKGKKYVNCSESKSGIFFGVDRLSAHSDKPLYVVEGVFDAINVNGIATLSNELSNKQLEILQNSKRRKILIPDFNGDSNKLAEQFGENGWEIAIPEWKKSCKDVSEAIIQYGRLYSFYDISKNIIRLRSKDHATILVNS